MNYEKKLAFPILIGLFLVAFLIRAQPFFLGSLEGPDPYFHARLSEQIVYEQSKPVYDELSQQGRNYSYAPLFHILFASLHLATGLSVLFLVNLLPAIYGAFAVFIIFIFARKFFSTREALFSAFLISLMTMHIVRTQSYARPDGLSLIIIPLLLYFLYTKRFKVATLLVIPQMLLHPLSTVYLLIFIIIWMAVYRFLKKPVEWKKFAIFIFVALLIWGLWLITLPYPLTDYVSKVSFDSSEFSYFAFMHIFVFFTISWIFLIVGFYKLKENLFLKLLFVFSLVYAITGVRLAIFLTTPVALIGAIGFKTFLEKVRPYSHVFFLLLLMLVLLAHAPTMLRQGVSVGIPELDAMEWIVNNTPKDANFMLQWDKGHSFAYFTGRKIVVDGYFEFADNLENRIAASREMSSSSHCPTIEKGVKEFNVNYFYVNRAALYSETYQYGMIEAINCEVMSNVYSSDHSKIMKYNLS